MLCLIHERMVRSVTLKVVAASLVVSKGPPWTGNGFVFISDAAVSTRRLALLCISNKLFQFSLTR
jgi:hypothetical protein